MPRNLDQHRQLTPRQAAMATDPTLTPLEFALAASERLTAAWLLHQENIPTARVDMPAVHRAVRSIARMTAARRTFQIIDVAQSASPDPAKHAARHAAAPDCSASADPDDDDQFDDESLFTYEIEPPTPQEVAAKLAANIVGDHGDEVRRHLKTFGLVVADECEWGKMSPDARALFACVPGAKADDPDEDPDPYLDGMAEDDLDDSQIRTK